MTGSSNRSKQSKPINRINLINFCYQAGYELKIFLSIYKFNQVNRINRFNRITRFTDHAAGDPLPGTNNFETKMERAPILEITNHDVEQQLQLQPPELIT